MLPSIIKPDHDHKFELVSYGRTNKLRYEYNFDEEMLGRLGMMTHGDHIYPEHSFPENTAFSMVIGYYYGKHYFIFNPMYPLTTMSAAAQYVNFALYDGITQIATHQHRLNHLGLYESDIGWQIDIKLIKAGAKTCITLDGSIWNDV